MKFNIFEYEKVTSTNDEAIKLIRQKKESGFVVSKIQSKGKGTHGKKWISKKGNFFGSFFFSLKKNYPTFDEFSLINSVIISNTLKKFCNNANISLKWPNDIFINKKKVCGILQELVTYNDRKFLIIGIGINIISNPVINEKYRATNIYFETKKKLSINEIYGLLITSYEKFFLNLKSYNYSNYKKEANLMVQN